MLIIKFGSSNRKIYDSQHLTKEKKVKFFNLTNTRAEQLFMTAFSGCNDLNLKELFEEFADKTLSYKDIIDDCRNNKTERDELFY